VQQGLNQEPCETRFAFLGPGYVLSMVSERKKNQFGKNKLLKETIKKYNNNTLKPNTFFIRI
jgi:hypothetical protein